MSAHRPFPALVLALCAVSSALVAVFMVQLLPGGDLDLADRFRTLVYQAIVGRGSAGLARP